MSPCCWTWRLGEPVLLAAKPPRPSKRAKRKAGGASMSLARYVFVPIVPHGLRVLAFPLVLPLTLGLMA